MNKSELRLKYKALRAELSSDKIEENSLFIANQLIILPIWKFNFYHLFLPIAKFNEVNTEFLMHIIQGKDKQIVVSKSDFETNIMQHFLLTENMRFAETKFGIPEPINNENELIEINSTKIDVVFVPLLAFDLQGNRVGYGKGFYDKFLANCKPTTIKIGISFFEAEEKISDVFAKDVKLDYCITPEKVYSFI
ncbi:MAG: 5-formyltetrahydrofolate cyclo-ligase [Flavobacterium sp.]|jgi:5-formyltetrahydrofolate cyclo-ligase